jgi:hypothetical protein
MESMVVMISIKMGDVGPRIAEIKRHLGFRPTFWLARIQWPRGNQIVMTTLPIWLSLCAPGHGYLSTIKHEPITTHSSQEFPRRLRAN